MKIRNILTLVLLTCTILSCQKKAGTNNNAISIAEKQINKLAETYAKTVLEIGLYDPLYVDAYYGPKEWKTEVESLKKEAIPSDELIKRTEKLISDLASIKVDAKNSMLSYRKTYLNKQFLSVKARIQMLSGTKFTFNQESNALYDAIVPEYKNEYFSNIINELEKVVPGKGDLIDRISKFKRDFVIPKDKVDAVFRAAIEESRKRTKQHIKLPENENFKLEYVTDKPWAGYNWYKGNNFSLIQVNIDYPIMIDRAIDLASHEGYPGHHVYNSLLETNIVKKRSWVEFSVYPLFSPQSLIAEGTANFGINVVFPKEDRVKFEKEVLFPLAGLNSKMADLYYKIQDLSHELTYARTTAMRNYLDGKWTKEETSAWMKKYALQRTSPASFRFPETYRSYIINYNLGQDMVKDYVERNGGTKENPEKRWEVFTHLISTPQIPSNLK